MNKWIAISVIAVLVVVIIAGGLVLIQQKNALEDDLTAANTRITGLEGNIVTLNGNISDLESKLLASKAEATSLQGKLTDSEATVKTLQTDLASANSRVKSLESDVSAQRNINSSLTAELKKIKDPRHFATLAELTDWLAKDDTNTKYANVSDWQGCFILQVRALRDGYLLPVNAFADQSAGNLAVIGDLLYQIRWQDDHSVRSFTMQPLPSRPLPLD